MIRAAELGMADTDPDTAPFLALMKNEFQALTSRLFEEHCRLTALLRDRGGTTICGPGASFEKHPEAAPATRPMQSDAPPHKPLGAALTNVAAVPLEVPLAIACRQLPLELTVARAGDTESTLQVLEQDTAAPSPPKTTKTRTSFPKLMLAHTSADVNGEVEREHEEPNEMQNEELQLRSPHASKPRKVRLEPAADQRVAAREIGKVAMRQNGLQGEAENVEEVEDHLNLQSLSCADSRRPASVSNMSVMSTRMSDVSLSGFRRAAYPISSGFSVGMMEVSKDWLLTDSHLQQLVDVSTEVPDDILLNAKLDAATHKVLQELRASKTWGKSPFTGNARRRTTMSKEMFHAEMIENVLDLQRWGRQFFKFEPFHPNCLFRLCWDLISLVLLIYDAVAIPLFLTILADVPFTSAPDYGMNAFWSMDIALTFATARFKQHLLHTDFKVIAQVYVRSWLLPDLVVTIMEWIMLSMQSTDQNVSVLRGLRTLRATRLVRIAKINLVVQMQLKRMNSVHKLHIMHAVLLGFAFLLANHFIACIWYFIGMSADDGWLRARQISEGAGATYLYGYSLAFHWTISQFHGSSDVVPFTVQERIFAAGMLFCGLLTFSIFVSLITDMFFRMRQARNKHLGLKESACNYLRRRCVSTEVVVAVKRHVEHCMSDDNQEVQERELMKYLPSQLMKLLLIEVRTPTIELHYLFMWLQEEHKHAYRDMCCSAFYPKLAYASHTVFARDESTQEMLFIESGLCRYMKVQRNTVAKKQQKLGEDTQLSRQLDRLKTAGDRLSTGGICEPALWMQCWQTRGELIAVSDTMFLCLSSSRLAEVSKLLPLVHYSLCIYARWVLMQIVNLSGDVYDLWRPDSESSIDDE